MANKNSPDEELTIETWYQQTVTKIYRFTYALLQNREEAEDITQETYLRCLRREDKELPSYPYLKQVARNLIYDRYRHLKLFPKSNLEQIDVKQDLGQMTTEDNWVDKTFIEGLMKQLPSHYQEVLELRIVQGYSRKETAKRMGRSEEAIRGLQYRALKALRDLMENSNNGG